MKKFLRLITGVLVLLALVGCTTPKTYPNAIQVKESKVTLNVGDNYQIEYSFLPEGTSDTINFLADNDNLSVSETGLVEAIKEGRTTVSLLTSHDVKKDIEFTIVTPVILPEEIVVTNESLSLSIDETYQIEYSFLPLGSSDTVTFYSSNPDVISVDDKGLLTAKQIGSVNITIKTAHHITKTIEANVRGVKVTSFSFNKSTITYKVGTVVLINFTIEPYNADDKKVIFSFSNDMVASIDENNYLYCKTIGNVEIRGKTNDGGFEDRCYLYVEEDTSFFPTWDESQNSLRTGTKSLDFYNFNDVHGALTENGNEPGIAKLSTYLKSNIKDESKAILTSSGDMWQGSGDSNITRGQLMLDWMKYLNFSAMAIGNHEFDWKMETIMYNNMFKGIPLLACNILYSKTMWPVEWVKPYTTVTRNGIRVGIIGAIGEGLTNSILSTNVKGLTFDDPTEHVKKYSTLLKEKGADIILYLLHDDLDNVDPSLANYVDVIFGGHSHSKQNMKIASRVPAVQGGDNGKYLSHVSIEFDFDYMRCEYTSSSYMSTSGALSMKEDSATKDLWIPYEELLNTTINRVVSDYNLTISRYDVPSIYNRYAYRYYLDTKENYSFDYPIYAVETNNARSDIAPVNGKITYGSVYKALPFDNRLMIIKMKGSNIKNNLCTYSSAHFYSVNNDKDFSNNEMANSVKSNDYYYLLMIDYIGLSEYYVGMIEEIHTYYEEEALPRNIVSTYLKDYPSNLSF